MMRTLTIRFGWWCHRSYEWWASLAIRFMHPERFK